MNIIENGGVTSAKGYKASGIYAAIKETESKKFDVGVIYSEVPAAAACVYTTNKVKGAPIAVTKNNLAKSGNIAKAIIVNSGNANTCNSNGEEIANKTCEILAENLGIDSSEVIIASTGVIGQKMSIDPFQKAIPKLVENLSEDGGLALATAIMTTDTVKKEIAVSFEVGGVTCTIGGAAKGSGMINPNMATNLNFITTDCKISAEMLQKALNETVKVTLNCLWVDGDTSTNDMACLMANGVAENEEITSIGRDYNIFKLALTKVMENLTKMLAKDGEGATKLLQCFCENAPDLDTALIVAKSVISSPLVKTAMFGSDANWGRILCAIGYAKAEFDITKVDVKIISKAGEIAVCEKGYGIDFSEEKAKIILTEDEIVIRVNLNSGEISGSAYGCDLTYDYVQINGDYRS